MIDERKIDFVANNLSMDIFEKNKKKLEKIIKDAYIKGFKDGVDKAAGVCNRCNGTAESNKNIADVCKSCKKNKAVIIDD